MRARSPLLALKDRTDWFDVRDCLKALYELHDDGRDWCAIGQLLPLLDWEVPPSYSVVNVKVSLALAAGLVERRHRKGVVGWEWRLTDKGRAEVGAL